MSEYVWTWNVVGTGPVPSSLESYWEDRTEDSPIALERPIDVDGDLRYCEAEFGGYLFVLTDEENADPNWPFYALVVPGPNRNEYIVTSDEILEEDAFPDDVEQFYRWAMPRIVALVARGNCCYVEPYCARKATCPGCAGCA